MAITISAPIDGISSEDHALIKYLEDSGIECTITCTINHSEMTNAGFKSRHVYDGSGGKGLAIDARGPRASSEPNAHISVFNALLKVEHQLHELIYAFAPFNIKSGKRVANYASADHKNHVHCSVDRGVFIRWPGGSPGPVVTPPASVPGDDDMRLWLFRIDGHPEVWITDMITKRHVKSETELDDLVYLNTAQDGKMLWVPESGMASGTGSQSMVRLLGPNSTLLDSIPTVT